MNKERGRWLIVADDITGAAQVAGAATSAGYRVRIVREGADPASVRAGMVVVLDTDTRSLPPTAAADRVERLIRPWLASGRRLVFKKTDSVLRGNVAAELNTCAAVAGFRSAVLISANPSRGRTIRNGMFLVDGVPLHETEFARDPEHPATASDLRQLLATTPGEHAHLVSPAERSPARIVTTDATSRDDLVRWARALSADQLPAGGVEFFGAWLEASGSSPKPSRRTRCVILQTPLLTVCGSRSIAGRLARDQLVRSGGMVLRAAHDLAAARLSSRRCTRWARNAADALQSEKMVVLETGRVNAEPALVRRAVGSTVAQVLDTVMVSTLLIEGGSTASAILTRMQWNSFDVVGEIEPGTVAMRARPDLPLLVLKPGTYRWPTVLLEAIERAAGVNADPIQAAAPHSSVSK